MAARFHVTYEIVTPDSAEHGEAAELGYMTPSCGGDPLDIVPPGAADYAMTLREAVALCGTGLEDCGRWFAEGYSERTNYRTGATTSYSLHPPANITAGSYSRLKRLLTA